PVAFEHRIVEERGVGDADEREGDAGRLDLRPVDRLLVIGDVDPACRRADLAVECRLRRALRLREPPREADRESGERDARSDEHEASHGPAPTHGRGTPGSTHRFGHCNYPELHAKIFCDTGWHYAPTFVSPTDCPSPELLQLLVA